MKFQNLLEQRGIKILVPIFIGIKVSKNDQLRQIQVLNIHGYMNMD